MFAKFASDGDVALSGYKEYDYFQEDLTAVTKSVVLARLNEKVQAGWTVIYTDHQFNPNQSAPSMVFHVLAR